MYGCSLRLLYRENISLERKNQSFRLLVSFMKPHNAVARSTVEGRVKQVLIMSGTKTGIFKPHSTRSPSS